MSEDIEARLRAALPKQLRALRKLRAAREDFDREVEQWGPEVAKALDDARAAKLNVQRIVEEVEKQLDDEEAQRCTSTA